jgi:formate hydrogenlyase subunit 6/NADH:ubiquinone oxidoreductase subunit I
MKYAPEDTNHLQIKTQPIAVPTDFRGKLKYEKEKCIGCKMCIAVCPANAMEFKETEKKIKHHVLRCTMCSFCVDACPVKCLSMGDEFLLAEIDKESKKFVVE